MMKIVECLWKEQFIEKLERKHNVSANEVEDVLLSIRTSTLLPKVM